MKLSIIIPVYKVEKYIYSTLDSIYNQRYDESEFEVIIVNDGTPDNSMDIVNRFAKTHSNLHIINQDNQGLSCARNSGLREAIGDYVWFVDSDDTIAANSICQIIDLSEMYPVDILGFDMVLVNETTKEEKIQYVLFHKGCSLYNKDLDFYSLQGYSHCAPVQRFLYKRSFLKHHNLFFYPGILHEDTEFYCRSFFFAKRIMMCPLAPYRYLVRNSGSIMSSLDMRSVNSRFKIIESFSSFKKEYAINLKERRLIDNEIFSVVTMILSMNLDNERYNEAISVKLNMMRNIAFSSFKSNVLRFRFRKILKNVLVMIHPLLYRFIFKAKQ